MNASIPVYRADGRLYDVVTERALARLQAAGLIARVVRHRKGHINRAILFVRIKGGAIMDHMPARERRLVAEGK